MAKVNKKGELVLSETEIKKQIKDYLKSQRVFFWWNLQGLGTYPGLPDISGLLDDGRPFFIEVKKEGGILSAKQFDFLQKANERKAEAVCVNSFEEFLGWFSNIMRTG